MSADCCCKNDGCSDGVVSACCLPTPDDKGTCEQLTECECLKRGGLWRNPDNYGVSPVPCNECFFCSCCGFEPNDGVYRWRGTRYKRHIFDRTFRCPPGTQQGGFDTTGSSEIDSLGNCKDPVCDSLCEPATGACCYDCGCAEGLTKCACRILQTASGPGTQYPAIFVPGSTCADACTTCACLNGSLVDVPSLDCWQAYLDSRGLFYGGTSCSELQADPIFWQELVARCANSIPPGGGGGGPGGPGIPFIPPIPPRPPQPPAPPKPCTRPPVYNPTCSYKVWFVVYSKRTEDPCYNRVEEVINLYRLPDFSTDSCNTLSCCGAPAPDCTDVEAMVVPTEFKRVTNCTFGDTDTQTGDITLKCNDEQVFQRYDNPCEPCPTSRVEKLKIVCNTAQFLRGCCDTKMNFLQFQIPETGIKVNGVWTLYYPAETVILDLRNRVCEGYDRNHPSCK